MVELLKPIVYPDDANNQENDIEVSFQLSPDTDYILSNSNLNKQFIPFSGEYWLQNYSPYPFFTDRNQLQFVYPDYSKGVMVKYVDEEGNEIHDPQTISGSKGDVYDASTDQYKLVLDGYTLNTSKLPQNSIGNFKDYTLKEVQGNSSGQFSEKAQTVTYIYKKNELPIATGKVVVKYIDTDGKSILKDVVRTGTVGEDYITEEKNISGYTFQEIRGNSKGKYTDKIQTITYVYTKNHIIKPKDELVNSGTKIINKTNPKVKNSSSEKSQKLPETGENKKRSILFFISGLTLITLGSTIIVFRHKKE